MIQWSALYFNLFDSRCHVDVKFRSPSCFWAGIFDLTASSSSPPSISFLPLRGFGRLLILTSGAFSSSRTSLLTLGFQADFLELSDALMLVCGMRELSCEPLVLLSLFWSAGGCASSVLTRAAVDLLCNLVAPDQ